MNLKELLSPSSNNVLNLGQEDIELKTQLDKHIHRNSATSPLSDIKNPSYKDLKEGNYQKAPIKVLGMQMLIENPYGSVRKGIDKDGNKWECELKDNYGEIKNIEGADGDPIDIFIKPHMTLEELNGSDKIHIVDQIKPDSGEFDEHKVVLGYPDVKEAKKAYLSNYNDGWNGIGNITELDIKVFKEWLKNGDLSKPYAELDSVGNEGLFGKSKAEKEKEFREKHPFVYYPLSEKQVSKIPYDLTTSNCRENRINHKYSNPNDLSTQALPSGMIDMFATPSGLQKALDEWISFPYYLGYVRIPIDHVELNIPTLGGIMMTKQYGHFYGRIKTTFKIESYKEIKHLGNESLIGLEEGRNKAEWIGVSLDKSWVLDSGYQCSTHVKISGNNSNNSISYQPRMFNQIKEWLSNGQRVKIFTFKSLDDEFLVNFMRNKLREIGLPNIELVNKKDSNCLAIYNDLTNSILFDRRTNNEPNEMFKMGMINIENYEENKWVGVDLDGTLAQYDSWKGNDHIGNVIPNMLDKIKTWLEQGKTVKIFTARAADPNSIPYIKAWLLDNGIGNLEITNVKDMFMEELWDDRAVQVIENTGQSIAEYHGIDKEESEDWISELTNGKYESVKVNNGEDTVIASEGLTDFLITKEVKEFLSEHRTVCLRLDNSDFYHIQKLFTSRKTDETVIWHDSYSGSQFAEVHASDTEKLLTNSNKHRGYIVITTSSIKNHIKKIDTDNGIEHVEIKGKCDFVVKSIHEHLGDGSFHVLSQYGNENIATEEWFKSAKDIEEKFREQHKFVYYLLSKNQVKQIPYELNEHNSKADRLDPKYLLELGFSQDDIDKGNLNDLTQAGHIPEFYTIHGLYKALKDWKGLHKEYVGYVRIPMENFHIAIINLGLYKRVSFDKKYTYFAGKLIEPFEIKKYSKLDEGHIAEELLSNDIKLDLNESKETSKEEDIKDSDNKDIIEPVAEEDLIDDTESKNSSVGSESFIDKFLENEFIACERIGSKFEQKLSGGVFKSQKAYLLLTQPQTKLKQVTLGFTQKAMVGLNLGKLIEWRNKQKHGKKFTHYIELNLNKIPMQVNKNKELVSIKSFEMVGIQGPCMIKIMSPKKLPNMKKLPALESLSLDLYHFDSMNKEMIGLEEFQFFNKLVVSVRSAKDNLYTIFNKDHLIGEIPNASMLYDSSKTLESKNKVELSKYVIYTPENVSSPMPDYLTQVKIALNRIKDLEVRLLDPLKTWAGLMLSDSSYIEKVWVTTAVEERNIKVVLEPLQKCFDGKQTDELEQHSILKAYPNLAIDLKICSDLINELIKEGMGVLNKDIVTKSTNLYNLMNRVSNDPDIKAKLPLVEKNKMLKVINLTYQLANEIELLAVLLFQVKIASYAHNKTLVKIKKEL